MGKEEGAREGERKIERVIAVQEKGGQDGRGREAEGAAIDSCFHFLRLLNESERGEQGEVPDTYLPSAAFILPGHFRTLNLGNVDARPVPVTMDSHRHVFKEGTKHGASQGTKITGDDDDERMRVSVVISRPCSALSQEVVSA